MELKEGMYVRFDYHRVTVPIQIGKITEVHYDETEDSYCYSTDIGLVITENNLVKEPSFNPIDLIEVGDYVNGCKVTSVYNPNGDEMFYIVISTNYGYFHIDNNKNIKSIVTKEQFESMSYKAGD